MDGPRRRGERTVRGNIKTGEEKSETKDDSEVWRLEAWKESGARNTEYRGERINLEG